MIKCQLIYQNILSLSLKFPRIPNFPEIFQYLHTLLKNTVNKFWTSTSPIRIINNFWAKISLVYLHYFYIRSMRFFYTYEPPCVNSGMRLGTNANSTYNVTKFQFFFYSYARLPYSHRRKLGYFMNEMAGFVLKFMCQNVHLS